jgi:predicted permease
LLGKDRRNDEIGEELQAYMDDAVEDRVRNGMSRDEALRVVRAEVGSVETVKHKVWSAGWEATMERFWSDVRYTLRRLAKSPGLVFVVVLSLALGIAANATIFSMVSKFALAPPPVGDPKTLTTVYRTYDNGTCCNALPMPVYRDLRDQAKSFQGVAAVYELIPAAMGSAGKEPARQWGQAVTSNFFDVMQLRMTQGRGFASSEEDAQVVVLGYDLWRQHFNSDPSIVGKPVTLGGLPFTVVGVASQGFRGVDLVLDPSFWVPIGTLPRLSASSPNPESRTMQWLRVAARLKPGVTEAQAAAEVQIIGERLAKAHPESEKGNNFKLWPPGTIGPRDFGTLHAFLGGLLVVVLLVLCIACANVANLLLEQGARRQREMAVRLALGAGRSQLLRQMLIESVLLSLAGGVCGVLLSLWATMSLSTMHPPAPVPLDFAVHVDWRVLVYAFVLSLVAGMLCGFVPAWRASRPKMPNALKGEDALARPGRRWNLRDVLVVTQVTLSVVLLCGAGLFLRSLQSAAQIDTGFRARGVLMMGVDVPQKTYTPERTVQLLTQVRQRMMSLPGVVSATTTDGLPLSGGHRSDGFEAVGLPKPGKDVKSVELYMAGLQYMETMGVPLLRGRELGEENPTAPKVAVVNQEFVREILHGVDPIGRQVRSGDVNYQIVGLVKDTKARTIGEEQRPVLFRAVNQAVEKDSSSDGYFFIVRYEGDSAALAAAMRNAIHAQDASLATFSTQTMEEHVREALFLPRLVSTLFGVFGITGLLLASVGLYGVMSYSVSQRTKEIGIRMALGAKAEEVQSLIVRGGMKLAILSVVLGVPMALGGAKLATSMLYGVQPYDVATFTVVPAFLLLVALVACWIPSRRAARVDPMVALRVD